MQTDFCTLKDIKLRTIHMSNLKTCSVEMLALQYRFSEGYY